MALEVTPQDQGQQAAPETPQKQRILVENTRLDMDQADGIPVESTAPPPVRDAAGRFVQPNNPAAQPPAGGNQHPSWTVEIAHDLGFTDQEISDMTPEILGRQIRIAQKRFSEYAPRAPQQSQPEQRQQAPVVEADPEIDLGLTAEQEEELGPDLVGLFKKQALTAAKENRALLRRLEASEQRDHQRTNLQMVRAIDDAFEGLGAEFSGVLGSGPSIEVNKSDPDAFRRRQFIIQSLRDKGIDPSLTSQAVLSKKVKEMAELEFGSRKKAAATPEEANLYGAANGSNGKPAVTKEQWSRAGTAVPTQRRNANEPTGAAGNKAHVGRRIAAESTEEAQENEKILSSLRRRKE